MSNFNYCERTGQVLPEDFIVLLTRESVALKVAETLRSELPEVDLQLRVASNIKGQEIIRNDEKNQLARRCAQSLVSGECELFGLTFSSVYHSGSKELAFEAEVVAKEEF